MLDIDLDIYQHDKHKKTNGSHKIPVKDKNVFLI